MVNDKKQLKLWDCISDKCDKYPSTLRVKQTYYNDFTGWGTGRNDKCKLGEEPSGEIVFIMRKYGHVLSPSYKLLNYWLDRKNNKITWMNFTKMFLQEMKSTQAKDEIKRLALLSKNRIIWVVCSCWNSDNMCHRLIVLDLIKDYIMKIE